MNGFRRDEML
ncbi:Protein of unknown function [Pyronema omphalodes CBS 100304]|uniref:Uncharacterized protein n=1 Tax=Pyronema omphalodes (strain CBS 100304) TaxID=1076935 RepID=U4LKK6_PYROM|nr:Protein of unknown function [Pyronema omphalodes CBS 100304]